MNVDIAKKIPARLLSRRDEITADFLGMAEAHIADLMALKVKKRFTAADFAAKLFIHPRHLTNTIKLTLNTSPCDIMEGRITAEAQKLLRQTNLSIAEIGQFFAYSEPTNFTKFFKNMTGLTPMQYRKTVR